jgi:hypothetical protein
LGSGRFIGRLPRCGAVAFILGCAPGVQDAAQTNPPPAAPAPAETPTAPPPQISPEALVRELEALARRPATRTEIDAFVAAHPAVVSAEAEPYGPALMWALELAQEEMALALVAGGSKIPGTALAVAARGGMDALVRELLARGASPDAGGALGYTPLHLAAKHGHASTVKLLLQAGAPPSPSAANDGFTPLHLAVIDRRVDAVRLLIEAKADLEARDGEGRTPLHWGPFAYAPQPKHLYRSLGGPHDTVFTDPGPAVVIGALLDAGARIDAADDGGNTPLHAAAAIGSKRGIEALLARGADPGTRNAAGETPIDLSRRRGDDELVNLMKRKWDKKK